MRYFSLFWLWCFWLLLWFSLLILWNLLVLIIVGVRWLLLKMLRLRMIRMWQNVFVISKVFLLWKMIWIYKDIVGILMLSLFGLLLWRLLLLLLWLWLTFCLRFCWGLWVDFQNILLLLKKLWESQCLCSLLCLLILRLLPWCFKLIYSIGNQPFLFLLPFQ